MAQKKHPIKVSERWTPGAWRPGERPERIVQINLGLADGEAFDADAVMGDIAALGATRVVMNVGGIYAWYPTAIAAQGRHPLLEGRDLVAEAKRAAHAHGLAFIGRFDFSLIEAPLARRDSDWLALTADGTPLEIGGPRTDGRPALLATAMTGGYRRGVALDILREAHDRTSMDGVFFNAPEPFDDHAPGAPRRTDPLEASSAFFENSALWSNAIHAVDPECAILGRFNAFQYRDLQALASTCDALTSQPLDWLDGGAETRRPAWFAGLTAKVGRRAMGERVPVIIVHAAPGLSWRHVGLPCAEARMWLAQVLANGGGLWHTLTGLPADQPDRRLLADVAWANARAAEAERWLVNTKAEARIGLVIPRRAPRHANPGADHSEAAGLIDALVSARRFFHPLSEADLSGDTLGDLDALILPSVMCLSDAEAETIALFAEAGGAVIATFRTGWCEADGVPRPTPVLAELLGYQPVAPEEGAQTDAPTVDDLYASYIALEPNLPISAWMEGTRLVAGQGPFVPLASRSDADVWAWMVPPFAARGGVGKPPERVALPAASDRPAIVAKGRCVTFAHGLGTLITRYGLPDHHRLFTGILDHLIGPEAVQVEAPPGVHSALFRQEDRLILHLVNAVGERPLKETVRLHDLTVRAPAAQGMTAVPGGAPLVRVGPGAFRLPYLDVWQIIEITF